MSNHRSVRLLRATRTRPTDRRSDRAAKGRALTQPAAPARTADPLEQLERLGQLKAQGIPTESEFEAQKQKRLGP